ncbi:gasdermin-A [Canis lupus familiaris]|uniref:Gasdermin A n=2 Tax=Canis lupus familiaris TaxID=9615 RepID=A0A8C0NAQ1_CANLF|nr:gasdermin-A [Canis lupus familiaris]XP_025296309.1 gasdermin-A [Canis lupus dingo]XP_038403334.1 gasdermin-A [Canis lupus familiaris]XP_038532511.1 gasdermin-A [Canis lupus familiaris]
MTIFENVTRALARQLNPRGDLTPLDSLIDFKRFHPFCLVLRKRKSTLFWGARYVRTDYTLLDVLEPGSSPSDPTDSGNFSFKNMLDARVEGEVDVPKTVKVTGTAGLSRSSTLEVQTLSVAPKALETLHHERKLSAEHPFLKEMRNRGENLYVVMEVVETVQEVTLERASKAEGCFSLPFFAPLGLQGSIDHKEAVTIPKGCILAFRVRQLMVKGKEEWDIPHICNDSMQTFPPEEKPEEKFTFILASDAGEEHENFKTLKEEVQREIQEVEKLSRVGQRSLLTSLSKLLGKKKELQDLELTLEGALDKGHEVTLEALPKDVLVSKEAMGGILYFLGALTELSEAQQKLLIKSMEKKILSVQLKLVESTMEHSFLQDKEGVFPLQPDLLSSLGEEELTLTEALVGLSGLEVQRSGPQYMWDPDTLPRLCALYAGLSLLQLLTKAS